MQVLSLEDGPPQMKILAWPSWEQTDQLIYIQAAAVLVRDGGVLLAIPGHAIPEEVLESSSQTQVPGIDPLVGPSTRVQVKVQDLDLEGPAAYAEETSEILLVDLDLQ